MEVRQRQQARAVRRLDPVPHAEFPPRVLVRVEATGLGERQRLIQQRARQRRRNRHGRHGRGSCPCR